MDLVDGGQSTEVIILITLFLGLSIVIVCARTYERLSRNGRLCLGDLELDDWLVVVALLFQIGLCITEDLNAKYGGFDQPQPQDSGVAFIFVNQLSFFGALFWNFPMLSIKLSVLHFYKRMFGVNSRFSKACWAMMVVVALYFLACLFTILFACSASAIPKNWDSSVPGHCIDGRTRMVVTAAINLTIDIVLVVLPMSVVWNLHVPIEKSRSVRMAFGAGFLFCITPAVRIYYASQTDPGDQFKYFLTTSLEPDLGILVVCLPSLWRLALRILGRRSSRWRQPQYTSATRDEGTGFRRNNASNKTESLESLREMYHNGLPYENIPDLPHCPEKCKEEETEHTMV